LLVTQYSDVVKLEEDCKVIKLVIFNKTGGIMCRKTIKFIHPGNIPDKLIITYRR
jgi:hypothetical protein